MSSIPASRTTIKQLPTRLELRLLLKQEGNETELHQLQRQIQELIYQMLITDPTIKFYPWYDREQQLELENSKVPGDIRSINKYFPRLKAAKTGFTHGEMRIFHTRRWEDIIFDLTDWLVQRSYGVYYQTLQCQSTTNIGWLLWSFRRIDINQLQKAIKAITGNQIQLRYQNIATGIGKASNGNTVRALHIIANQKEADHISNVFQQLYSFDTTAFPLGIVMRFIPHVLKVNHSKKPKLLKFRSRQDSFLRAIEDPNRPMAATSWEVIALDKEVVGMGTLRQAVMAINSKLKKDESLFLSVDTSFFRNNEVIFTFLPRHEMEAREFVSNMVPYFYHKFKNVKLQSIFQPEALERASETIWNADTEEIVTLSDLYLDSSDNIKDNFDMLEVMGIDEAVIQHLPQDIERVERLFVGEDSTSVGSIFTQNVGTNIQTNNLNQTIITPNNTSTTTRSVCTTLTIEDVDKRMTVMSTELAQIKSMLHELSNQNRPIDQPQQMEEDQETGQKRKAGEQSDSTCSQP
jgi:hypothetical protein